MKSVAIFFLLLVGAWPFSTFAKTDSRLSAVISMSSFGIVGGALLGVASQAFNNTDSLGRSTAKGASLGLYGGLLFGSYLVVAHIIKKNSSTTGDLEGSYYQDASPEAYSDDLPGGGDAGIENSPPLEGPAQFWRPYWGHARHSSSLRQRAKLGSLLNKTPPVFFINLFRLEF